MRLLVTRFKCTGVTYPPPDIVRPRCRVRIRGPLPDREASPRSASALEITPVYSGTSLSWWKWVEGHFVSDAGGHWGKSSPWRRHERVDVQFLFFLDRFQFVGTTHYRGVDVAGIFCVQAQFVGAIIVHVQLNGFLVECEVSRVERDVPWAEVAEFWRESTREV